MNNWQDKLIDLIEEEITFATGVKLPVHFSGECNINKILELVEKLLKAQNQDLLERLKKAENGWRAWIDFAEYIAKDAAEKKKKTQNQEPHLTKEGYCCACEYDIMGFENKLEVQNQEEYKRGYNQRLKDEGKVGERWTHLYL